nr:unnamed protein product [Callosobruchus analis]
MCMGQEFLDDDERPGYPVEVITGDKMDLVEELVLNELGINKDRYKSLADEMDSTFAELAGY